MSSPITHIAVGYALYAAFRSRLPRDPIFRIPARWAWPLGAMAVSLVPDVDAVIGIPLRNLELYHNNLTHSLLAALAAALALTPPLRWITRLPMATGFAFVLAGVAGHLAIDLLTDSRGLMLLWPFSQQRFTSPVTFFTGVPWSRSLGDPLYLDMLLYDSCFALALAGIVWLLTRHRRELAQSGQTT